MPTVQGRLMHGAGLLSNALYRATGGRVLGTVRGLPVLLLTVPGRKSGRPRTTAVAYLTEGESFVVTGSAGGSASEPQWFRNLRQSDRAVVEVGRRVIEVDVAIAGPGERTVLWDKLTSRAPFFAQYQEKAGGREIPMASLTPVVGQEPQ